MFVSIVKSMSNSNDYRPENTVYVGNLNEKVTEKLLYELFIQAGPVVAVTIPKNKEGQSRFFGFVEFKDNISVPYACDLMHGIELFHYPLVVKPQNIERRSQSNNDTMRSNTSYGDERILYDDKYRSPIVGASLHGNKPYISPYYQSQSFYEQSFAHYNPYYQYQHQYYSNDTYNERPSNCESSHTYRDYNNRKRRHHYN